MLLDMYDFSLNFRIQYDVLVMLLILFIIIDSNLICADPRSKAYKIVKQLMRINKYKRDVNRLLTITMKTKDIRLIVYKLYKIKHVTADILNTLDYNSKTIKYRKSLIEQLKEIDVIIDELVLLVCRRTEYTEAIDEYDSVLHILRLYRPIYNRIHQVVEVDDLIL
jgi:hypothetical protein